MYGRKKYLHNRLAESLVTLPVCLFIALSVWAWRLWQIVRIGQADWLQALVAIGIVLTTMYMVTETNNTFQIIRARTRLTAALVVLFLSLHPTILTEWGASVPALLLTISYPLIFYSYQQREMPGCFFYAVLLLSVGSLFAAPLIILYPFYLIYMTVFMRCMSLRTFTASLLGLVLPYAFWATGCFLTDTPCHFLSEQSLTEQWGQTLWNSVLPTHQERVIWWCLIYYSVISLVHYWRHNYSDKIRTRQILYIFVCQSVMLHILLFLNPQHFTVYASCLAVSNAPLLAHYLTLTRTRWCLVHALCCIATFVYLLYTIVWMH